MAKAKRPKRSAVLRSSKKRSTGSRDRVGTERKILEAAAHVFAERGFDLATTREIASRADANEALISRYFGGKTGLLNAIMNEFTNHAKSQLCRNSPLPATVREEILGYFDHIQNRCPVMSRMVRVAVSRALVDATAGKVLREHFLTSQAPVIADRLGRILASSTRDSIPRAQIESAARVVSSVGFSTIVLGRELFGLSDGDVDRITTETAQLVDRSMCSDLKTGKG